jgi:hypothetical protein
MKYFKDKLSISTFVNINISALVNVNISALVNVNISALVNLNFVIFGQCIHFHFGQFKLRHLWSM